MHRSVVQHHVDLAGKDHGVIQAAGAMHHRMLDRNALFRSWLTPFMIISGGNFASTSGLSGANSTSRNLVPLSGGDTPIGRTVSLLKRLGGVPSVIQKLVEEITG